MTSDEKSSGTAPAMTVGTELRQAREERGISLRELSERTKIRQPVLRAIESDDLRQLPGGAIGRGFVKLYAREVGLDAHGIAERFDAQRELADARDGADELGAGGGTRLTDLASGFTGIRVAMVLATIAVLAGAYFALRPGPGSPAIEEPGRVAVEAVRPADTPPPAAPAAPPAPVSELPAETAQAPPGTVRVDLQATGDCWVAATADGQQVIYRVLPAGERATMSATAEAVVRIGMPANVTVTINGRPIRPFERPGSPITLRITPANYRDLVQP